MSHVAVFLGCELTAVGALAFELAFATDLATGDVVDMLQDALRTDDAQGMRALGRDMRCALPGLYWLNVFGPPYRRLIGDATLQSAPAAGAQPVGSSLVLTLYDRPEDWTTFESRRRHQLALEHLGPRVFYDRNLPDAETIAPDFDLPR